MPDPMFHVVGLELHVIKDLPPGMRELKFAKPRRAAGSNNRNATWCGTCGGWIWGLPLIQDENDTESFKDGRVGRVTRCRRCGEELSFTGVYHREQVKESIVERPQLTPPVRNNIYPPKITVGRGTGGIGS